MKRVVWGPADLDLRVNGLQIETELIATVLLEIFKFISLTSMAFTDHL